MSIFNSCQSGTAILMALAITAGATAPIVTPVPAFAQYQGQISILAGNHIPVRYNKANKIVVSPNETTPLTLTVANDITDRSGRVLIPGGTKVVGQLEPAKRGDQKGSQFVARELVFNSGRREYINATSPVITRTQRVTRGASTGSILKGTAAGAGAAALIAGVTGDRHIQGLDILGGAAAGTVGGLLLGKTAADVVVIYPNRDLNLTLHSNLPVFY